MSLTPKALYAFAAQIRRSLLHIEIARKRPLLPRLRRTTNPAGLNARSHSTVTSPPNPSQYDATILSKEAPIEDFRSVTSNVTLGKDVWVQPPPTACPGCGALSQTVRPNEAGFYSSTRKAVRTWLRQQAAAVANLKYENSIHLLNENPVAQQQNNSKANSNGNPSKNKDTSDELGNPVCDRCHDLIYNNKGQSIAHPSVEDLADSIAESPFKRNHVYHVLDAADFPMSLIPKIFKTLELAKPRSQNRRARTKFAAKPTISFIITRADLLGPSKQMVDKMMPYFQRTLRSALGRQGKDMRLGNVHLVSAKRGWWTKELKDSIWERGGGNWMVGKVNVGKSNLFPVLFPKGSGDRAPVYAELEEVQPVDGAKPSSQARQDSFLQENSLLPPAQPELRFPIMPVVSHLPGTTASPIRLPYGNHKGELIDLPGLDRGNLERYVHLDHKLDLVMQYRPNVKQYIIKPGQSLLLGGGLIRLTPQLDVNDPSTTMLAYPFVPIDAHVTATDKAVATQLQHRESGIKSIVASEVGATISSGGLFTLGTDVTRIRASVLLRAGVPMSQLPFRVYSTDILVEGVGWIELVCQVRKQRSSQKVTLESPVQSIYQAASPDESHVGSQGLKFVTDEPMETKTGFKPFFQQKPLTVKETEVSTDGGFSIPKVEVFSPNGEHVGQREPLGAWTLWYEGIKQRRKATATMRPRKAMKGVKKREKIERRSNLIAEVI